MKLNWKAIGHIRHWLEDIVFHHVSNGTCAHSLWKKLEDFVREKVTRNKVFFIGKLVNLKFKVYGSIVEHLNKVQCIVNQLSTMKMVLDDDLETLLLSSVPDGNLGDVT